MNAGMVIASMPASVSKTQNQTAVKTSEIEHSFGSILGQVILSPEAKVAEPVDAGKLSEEQLSILNELINELSAEGNNGKEEVDPDILHVDETAQLVVTELEDLQQLNDKSNLEIENEENLVLGEPLNSALLDESNLVMMMNMLNEKITVNEEIDLTEILPILTTLANMGEDQWSRLDINKIGEILKFTKLQEGMISANPIADNEVMISKILKQQLDTILTKLESMVESKQQKSSESSTFNKVLADGASLALIKNTYMRNFASVNQESEKKLVQASTLRALETTQTGQSFILQMSKLEQFVTVEKSGQPVTQEQFVKAFETILNKSSFTNANGTQKLFIQLNPEHLGSMRIELIQKDNVMVARIMATTAHAKELLESQLSGLKHSFVGQGIQIEKIEISQQLSTFSQERFHQRDSDKSEQQNQQQDKQADEETTTEFTNQFEEALLNVEV